MYKFNAYCRSTCLELMGITRHYWKLAAEASGHRGTYRKQIAETSGKLTGIRGTSLKIHDHSQQHIENR